MKIIWCEDLEDIINLARAHGWMFHYRYRGKEYYYVYAGAENELLCMLVEAEEPLKGKYVSIDDDGKLLISDRPIMPACARVVGVLKDPAFEELLEQSTLKR